MDAVEDVVHAMLSLAQADMNGDDDTLMRMVQGGVYCRMDADGCGSAAGGCGSDAAEMTITADSTNVTSSGSQTKFRSGGKVAKSFKNGHTDSACADVFLRQLRDTRDPRAAQAKAVVDALYGICCNSEGARLRDDMVDAMKKTGGRPKFILRKWAAAMLDPRQSKRKEQWEVLGLRAELSVKENMWTKSDAHEILLAVYHATPESFCIPYNLRTRSLTMQVRGHSGSSATSEDVDVDVVGPSAE